MSAAPEPDATQVDRPLVLRAAVSLDAGAVGDILSDFIDSTDWMPRIHTRAEDLAHAAMLVDRGWVTVAVTRTGVAGFIARDGVEVHALYVARPARGQGIGTGLLTAAKRSSAELGLWTFAANLPAQRFYARAGFRRVASTDGDNDEGLPDIRYHWKATRP